MTNPNEIESKTLDERLAELSIVPLTVDEVVEGEVVKEEPVSPYVSPPIWVNVFVCIEIMLLSAYITTLILPLVNAEATVTLTLKQLTLATDTSVPIVSIHTRTIDAKVSESVTVPATGTGYQPSTSASGYVTLYNVASYEQTIDAGTLITASNGSQILTDQVVVIPAANLPVDGSVDVGAHTVMTGSNSNLPAGAISGHCCKMDVIAYGGAFVGGTDERKYVSASAQDIAGATASLSERVSQQTQAEVQKELRTDEASTTPVCHSQATSSVKAGQEARNVKVKLDMTCTAFAYQESIISKLALDRLVARTPRGYSLYYMTNMKVDGNNNSLSMHLVGIYRYNLTASEQMRLSKLLAGKTRTQANAILKQENGIVGETISSAQDKLPGDPGRIHFVGMYKE